MTNAPQSRRSIAIIGGGVAGLTCGYLLHARHDVTLFEKTARVGGNAMTIDASDGNRFDMAVALYSRAGYTNFYRLLGKLGLKTSLIRPMLTSVQNLETHDGFYITPTLGGLIAQRFAIMKPSMMLSLFRLQLGLGKLRRLNAAGKLEGLTLAEALALVPGIAGPGKDLLLCALCLMSSQECEEVLDAPAPFFIAKLDKYNDVVTPRAIYSLQCMQGGSRRYIEALASPFQDRIELNADIRSVRRDANLERGGVQLLMTNGKQRIFDDVIFACNADQALALLEVPTPQERELLGAWRYRDGRVVVHQDHSSFPRRELIQGYTFLYRPQGQAFTTSVSGAIWALAGVDQHCNWISSQHPNFPIRKNLIEFETVLRTPVFEKASCDTIRKLPTLNGVQHSHFCGSHFGFGLHEDAITSAINVARSFGAEFQES